MKFATSTIIIVCLAIGLIDPASLAAEPALDENNKQVRAFPPSCGLLTFTQDPKAFKVLFIGNSITYWHDIPRIFAWLMSESEPQKATKIAFVVGNNYKLKDHWDAKLARKFISKEGPWDYVVIQNKSGAEYRNDVNQPYLNVFVEAIRAANAKPILFQNYVDKPDESLESERFFYNLSAKGQVDLLPVGKVWTCARKQNPDSVLYDHAGHHPSLIGSYLIALTTYVKLRQQLPNSNINKLNYEDYRDGTSSIFQSQAEADKFFLSVKNCLSSLMLRTPVLNR